MDLDEDDLAWIRARAAQVRPLDPDPADDEAMALVEHELAPYAGVLPPAELDALRVELLAAASEGRLRELVDQAAGLGTDRSGERARGGAGERGGREGAGGAG